MKSAGIVVEYNPFHNGHYFHVKETRRLSNADVVIAVMSGNFLQRGEPALVSKWARTKMALQSGIDIVIELPYVFAVQKAETFSYGAVFLLNALKCTSICFGSEMGEITPFLHTVKLINEHKIEYDMFIREIVKTGVSYPTALGIAYEKLNPNPDHVDLTTPNNILGYHYISAATKINPSLNFFTIPRKNANHHEQEFTSDSIASATSIRRSLNNELNLNNIRPYIPEATFIELNTYLNTFHQLHDWEVYWPLLQYKLISTDNSELRKIYEVEEGIENRLKKAAISATSFSSFMSLVKTKRYTWTRIQRICVHLLMNTKKSTIHRLSDEPEYIRLLGMSDKGREYLRSVKKDLQLPLISKVSAHTNHMLEMDIQAANLYALGLKEPYKSELIAMEYAQPPFIQ